MERVLREARRPMGVQELLRAAGLHPGRQTDVKRVLRELVRAGALEREGKRFVHPAPAPPEQTSGRRTDRPMKRPREAGMDKGAGRTWKRRETGAGKATGRSRVRGTSFEVTGRSEGGRLRQGEGGLVEGTLKVHRDGFGFVHPKGATNTDQDVFLPPHEAARAIDNDVVLVEVVEGRGGRTAGRIVRVVERRREALVGVYRAEGRRVWVEPLDGNLEGRVRVPATQLAQDGDAVKVRLGVGRDLVEPGEGLFGEVTGSLGKPGAPSAEVLNLAFAQGFSDEFPAEVMDEADRIALVVSEAEAAGEERQDLRHLPLVTIDGEDARDFDDAVYAERTGTTGFRLWVAIADVSHYVKRDTALDAEALHRATSVYLPRRVLPMLPERLSNGICSLRPHEDRLCMVAEMRIAADGQLTGYELYPGVMRSAARCTYEEVQSVMDGADVPGRTEFRPQFEVLLELSRTLTRMRERRGAIDFDLPETRVLLGNDGHPERMEKRERKPSHRLIEECMLAANEAVARFFQEEGLPSVYRYHGAPDEEKLATFATLAQAHGFVLGARGEITPHELNAFLKELEGHPEQLALNQLLLRSMMQAIYSAENVGHFGLGAEYYLHFTSPIRRYPDLLVHRLLKLHWSRRGRKPSEVELERETELLERMAEQCSERERAAMQVEREVKAFYSTLLLKDRLGDEFQARVISVTDFGFFVELEQELVEGLVRADSVGFGGKLDPLLHVLAFPDGRRVRVGQRLVVRLTSANLQRRQLEFEPVTFEPATEKSSHPLSPLAVAPRRHGGRRFERSTGGNRAPGRRSASRTSEVREFEQRGQTKSEHRGQSKSEHRGQAKSEHRGQSKSEHRGQSKSDRAWDGTARAAEEERSGTSSPHPGFDRLRAQALAQGRSRGSSSRSGSEGARGGRGGKPGKGQGGRSSKRR